MRLEMLWLLCNFKSFQIRKLLLRYSMLEYQNAVFKMPKYLKEMPEEAKIWLPQLLKLMLLLLKLIPRKKNSFTQQCLDMGNIQNTN